MAALLEGGELAVEVSEDLSTWVPQQDRSCIVLGVGGGGDIVRLRAFREDHAFTPVVTVSDELDVSTFARLIRAGATAAMGESESGCVLRHVVLAALDGRVSVSSDMARQLAGLVPDDDDLASWVSETEVEWLRAMAAGLTVLELAEDVGYSERAMFRHLKNMYVRIGVKNRTEALLWASRHGLLREEHRETR